jgi:diacylglycerol kinase
MYPSVTVAVVVVGLSWRFGPGQWAMITCAIVAVWIAEALRSAVDRLCEGASPDLAPYLEEAKEVAAAAVLIASVGALVIVVLAVSPYLRAG